jgi:putative DNA primase/helicase
MIDVDAAIDTFASIFEAAPEGAVFLTALGPNGAVHSLASRETDRIESFLQRHDRAGAGLYFCVSTLREGANGRSKNNVGWVAGLHADVDYKDHDLAPEEIKRRLSATLLPASLVIETGGGLHCYWLFHEAEAATPEAVARVETALRRLADHIGGDPQCAECARLMRVPGTVNYKREIPVAARVLGDRPAARYELAELEEWLTEARPLLTRRPKQGNGAGEPFAAYAGNGAAPIDVEARLAALRHQGAGDASIHKTQVQVTAALLERGEAIDDVVAKVLAATKLIGDPAWDWAKEERDICGMCESWLKKHPRGEHEPLLAELARLSRFEYDRRRKTEAKRLGIQLSTLDREVAELRAQNASEKSFLPHWSVEPWPDPVGAAELLDELRAHFKRYVVLPEHADIALALWTLNTWVFESFDVAPYLSITSPTRRCGKTVLMTMLYWLCRRGKKSDSMSKPAIYRSVDTERPTLVLDEVGWVLDPKDERQGILCGGFERNGFVEVCEGEGTSITTRLFSTFCPKAFGLIGQLTATLTDRSIVIPMQRKMPSEKAERLRRRDSDEHAQLRRQCLRWANDNAKALEQAAPPALACLNDRACDLWEPLLAIAERAAGEWPERARAAALALSGAGANEDDTRGIELLADVKKAFAACGLAELPTKALIAALCADPERPWAAYAKGEQITDRQLAKLLRPFGIVSVTVHPPNAPDAKGYRRADLEEAWGRYL